MSAMSVPMLKSCVWLSRLAFWFQADVYPVVSGAVLMKNSPPVTARLDQLTARRTVVESTRQAVKVTVRLGGRAPTVAGAARLANRAAVAAKRIIRRISGSLLRFDRSLRSMGPDSH